MKHELDRIEEKCERLEANVEGLVLTLGEQSETLSTIKETLVLNTQSLQEHMRRTALLEKEIKPLVKHVEQVRGAGKLLALLALIATIVALFR